MQRRRSSKGKRERGGGEEGGVEEEEENDEKSLPSESVEEIGEGEDDDGEGGRGGVGRDCVRVYPGEEEGEGGGEEREGDLLEVALEF